MSTLTDGLRLAVGTLTVVPVPPPRTLRPAVAAVAMSLAPLAAAPVAMAGAGALLAGAALALPSLLTATLAVGSMAAMSGALHLDGLADAADGLAAGGGSERRLEVMRRGDVGPVGATVLVLVLLAQVAALAGLLDVRGTGSAAVTLVLAVGVSRATLALACVRGRASARPEGLGADVTGTVPLVVVVLVGLVLALATGALHGTRGLVGLMAATSAVGLVLFRTRRSIGGVTGDVLGACVEVALTVYLVAETADLSAI